MQVDLDRFHIYQVMSKLTGHLSFALNYSYFRNLLSIGRVQCRPDYLPNNPYVARSSESSNISDQQQDVQFIAPESLPTQSPYKGNLEPARKFIATQPLTYHLAPRTLLQETGADHLPISPWRRSFHLYDGMFRWLMRCIIGIYRTS